MCRAAHCGRNLFGRPGRVGFLAPLMCMMNVVQSAGRKSTETCVCPRVCSQVQLNCPLKRTRILREIVAITIVQAWTGLLHAAR